MMNRLELNAWKNIKKSYPEKRKNYEETGTIRERSNHNLRRLSFEIKNYDPDGVGKTVMVK